MILYKGSMNTQTDIITIKNLGGSPIILTGPHNGWGIPDDYLDGGKPLGLDPYWFDPKAENRRHEACDWGMQDLFNIIENKAPEITLASAQMSRLLVDLNRIPSVMIYESSSETGADIPLNMNLDTAEKAKREALFYDPYHAKVDKAIQTLKDKHGDVLWIDMHSFTPTWNGVPRPVGVGSLKLDKSPLNEKAEKWLNEQFGELFVPDEPYDLRVSPFREINGGSLIAERNGLEYFGLEIRSDLLSTPAQLNAMADQMIALTKHLSA